MKRIRIKVSGRVQGVAYRHSALTMARYMGVRGFARNLNDGSVYIEAEAEEKLNGFKVKIIPLWKWLLVEEGVLTL